MAALLHGPDGSGRATAAAAAAAALGIHLVPYSCLELKVQGSLVTPGSLVPTRFDADPGGLCTPARHLQLMKRPGDTMSTFLCKVVIAKSAGRTV